MNRHTITALMITMALGMLPATFAADLPTDAPAPLPPTQAATSTLVPEGFKVTLFAGEPDVVQPVGFAIDDRGRLWVAEALNYPIKQAERRDRIVIFEDADGDGRFDKRTVFYDKLEYVTGIEVGFGGAWVMSPPNLYFIPDADGDDEPDGPAKILLDGFGIHANAHNLANGFRWGPDGWLYCTHGRTNWSMAGRPGTPDEKRMRIDGGIWRYHPITHEYELFADGTTNPWGVDFDDYGEGFVSNCVTPHFHHMVQGGHFEPWRNRPTGRYSYQRLPSIADHKHFAGAKWQASRSGDEHSKLGGGHAHCGTMIYLGDNWPDRYRNTGFMCNIHGRRVNNDKLAFRGSTYVATHAADVMQSQDPWFKGTWLRYGPSGEVYISDWSDTGECHDVNNTQRDTGRIFRITYGDLKRAPVNVAELSDAELVAAQLHKNDWHVTHARRVMQERHAAGKLSDDVAPALRRMFDEQTDVTRKLRALWALHAIGAIDDAFLVAQLGHDSDHVRGWAVRLLCEDRNPPAVALTKLTELAGADPSPRVRLQLASALQRLPLEKRWAIAETLIAHGEDADDAYLPLMYWYAIEPLVAADTKRGLSLVTKTKIPLLRTFIAKRIADTK